MAPKNVPACYPQGLSLQEATKKLPGSFSSPDLVHYMENFTFSKMFRILL